MAQSPATIPGVAEMTRPTQVGALAAQMASYLKEFTTTVVSCTPVLSSLVKPATGSPTPAQSSAPASPTDPDAVNASEPKSPTEFDVVFHNSILFPEGGGQPYDTGVINDTINVKRVRRMGDTCVVTTDAPLEPGQQARMILNWARRWDHMQHHSAQHLLTALVESVLGLPTESWALSTPTCYIQVPSANVSQDDLQRVEDRCNEAIAAGTPVLRHVFESRDAVPESRSRGIPADVNGPIRLIEVSGIDTCTCCGTHVDNLRELHIVKLLHFEPKGSTGRIHFVAGNRAIEMFGLLYRRERALIKEVGTNADNLLSTVQRRSKELSDAQKQAKKLLEEVAVLTAPRLAEEAKSSPDPVFTYLREDGDVDFLQTVAEAIRKAAPSKLCVLGCGSLKGNPGEGAFLVVGEASQVKELAERSVCPGLEGKGGFNPKQGYRGKCNMRKWKALVKGLGAPPAPATDPGAPGSS